MESVKQRHNNTVDADWKHDFYLNAQQLKLENVELVFQLMILEVAILDVKPDLTEEFEAAFKTASPIIASMSHQPV
jgi:hypothetical protein